MSDQIQRLREVAEAATTRGPWVSAEQTHGEWFGLQSPYFALGTAFERGDAEHIATFDPPTVLELLDRLEGAEAAVERVRELALQWDSEPALPPSTYQAAKDVLDALDGGER